MNKKFYIRKSILYTFLLTIIFSIIIFFIKNYYFIDEKKQAEEKYIEYSSNKKIESNIPVETPPAHSSLPPQVMGTEGEVLIKQNKQEEKKKKVDFVYVPDNFLFDVKDVSSLISEVLNPKTFNEKIQDEVKIELNKDIVDSRGQMKEKTVKLFGVKKMEDEEAIAVFVHEFSHYIDIYSLDRVVFEDISDYFYDISWVETKIIKSGQKQEDFVSGYSMTNKYEDFAETATYYVLHNFSFLEKTKKSIFLKGKYDFFSKYIFRKNEFQNIDFSTEIEIKNYYRDITKIKINTTNFLQYLLNEI